jgi:hypothetical protein
MAMSMVECPQQMTVSLLALASLASHGAIHRNRPICRLSLLRLSALMIFYFHPLYILVIKILSSILISLAPIHLLYYHLSTVGPTCHFI